MPNQTPAEAAVARGMALLDKKLGEGWDERVNLEILDIGHNTMCACAQATEKKYYEGLKDVGLTDRQVRRQVRVGFLPDLDGLSIDELNAAWRAAIAQRRAARPVSPDAP